LPAIKERLAELERAAKARASEPRAVAAVDDKPLRRVVAATLLDLSVHQGEPYAAPLDAAKPLAADPAALKPLDSFAASGIPSAAVLSRELLALLPKLTASQDVAPGTGVVDRLQAGAERLVRVQRGEAGVDRVGIATKASAAAKRNDLAEARRELNALPEPDRGPVKAWIDKVDTREAALAASRQFAAAALSALPKTSP
jgi:hypothetical protein